MIKNKSCSPLMLRFVSSPTASQVKSALLQSALINSDLTFLLHLYGNHHNLRNISLVHLTRVDLTLRKHHRIVKGSHIRVLWAASVFWNNCSTALMSDILEYVCHVAKDLWQLTTGEKSKHFLYPNSKENVEKMNVQL